MVRISHNSVFRESAAVTVTSERAKETSHKLQSAVGEIYCAALVLLGCRAVNLNKLYIKMSKTLLRFCFYSSKLQGTRCKVHLGVLTASFREQM